MKRNSELCRRILAHIETQDNISFAFAGADEQTIAGHVRLLTREGLIAGVAAHVLCNGHIVLEDCHVHLTPEGHKALDDSRRVAARIRSLCENPWVIALVGLVTFCASVVAIVQFVLPLFM